MYDCKYCYAANHIVLNDSGVRSSEFTIRVMDEVILIVPGHKTNIKWHRCWKTTKI